MTDDIMMMMEQRIRQMLHGLLDKMLDSVAQDEWSPCLRTSVIFSSDIGMAISFGEEMTSLIGALAETIQQKKIGEDYVHNKGIMTTKVNDNEPSKPNSN